MRGWTAWPVPVTVRPWRPTAELEAILGTYEEDNCSAWDVQPDGEYLLRHPGGRVPRGAQEVFIERSAS